MPRIFSTATQKCLLKKKNFRRPLCCYGIEHPRFDPEARYMKLNPDAAPEKQSRGRKKCDRESAQRGLRPQPHGFDIRHSDFVIHSGIPSRSSRHRVRICSARRREKNEK
jgi:hypothetical protein